MRNCVCTMNTISARNIKWFDYFIYLWFAFVVIHSITHIITRGIIPASFMLIATYSAFSFTLVQKKYNLKLIGFVGHVIVSIGLIIWFIVDWVLHKDLPTGTMDVTFDYIIYPIVHIVFTFIAIPLYWIHCKISNKKLNNSIV